MNETCGRDMQKRWTNLWKTRVERRVEEMGGRDMWQKRVVQTCGKDMWHGRVDKVCDSEK